MHERTGQTSPHQTAREVVSFGPFQFHASECRLTRHGEAVKLGGRALDLLRVLLENEGETVSHKELMARVWPGIFVGDICLRVHIAGLRKALDSGEEGASHIRNVPGRGYAFAAATSRTLEVVATLEPLYAMPPLPPGLVGRDGDVHEIRTRIGAHRLVTVVGPGGMGKTTVALAVGHALLGDFAGAVCFADLTPATGPGLAGVVASAFGLRALSADPVTDLAALLRGRRALLILDNAEHLSTDVASLTERLLGELPKLRILVTSREPLRAGRETVHRLPPLQSPAPETSYSTAEIAAFPAVRLFLERLASGGMSATLNDADLAIVASICRTLGGVALAIELAAGRAGTFGLAEIQELLDSQFALRWPGRRTAPPRHRTLNATLDWSYRLLAEEERKVLRRLAVFVGGFTHRDALSVAADEDLSGEAVSEAFEGLCAKSLIAAHNGGSNATCYRLLEITRTYAAMRLSESGEQDAVRRRHARHIRDSLLQQLDAEPDDGKTGGPGQIMQGRACDLACPVKAKFVPSEQGWRYCGIRVGLGQAKLGSQVAR